MTSVRYIVGYKDGREAQPKYFGPFVSESVAEFFIAALPSPNPGGWVKTQMLQPFGVQEGRTVAQLIERERVQSDAQRHSVGRHH